MTIPTLKFRGPGKFAFAFEAHANAYGPGAVVEVDVIDYNSGRNYDGPDTLPLIVVSAGASYVRDGQSFRLYYLDTATVTAVLERYEMT